MVTVITGATTKPMASEQLKSFFLTHTGLEGYLYIGYPIIGTVNGAFPIDALWISPKNGLVVFNLIEGKDVSGYEDDQDECYNKIEAKLKGYKELTEKRQLCVTINVVTFAPAVINIPAHDESYPFCNEKGLYAVIEKFSWDKPKYYNQLLSVLQAVSTIRNSKKKREIVDPQSRAAKLKQLEDSIANLDNRQSRAVIETIEGVQRIRGLAGSGKTIILALKAAYLHAQHPEWKIAVTFNTRSLKGQFKHLINTFYIEQTSEEPDWDNLQIIHAWGASGGGERNGLYYTFCIINNVDYSDYMKARQEHGNDDPFGKICEKALLEANTLKQVYDVILVDEAQDFSPSFLRLCFEMLKPPKRLVYAYDELQNLRLQSLPSPEIIFGKSPNGKPIVEFTYDEDGNSNQDIILEKCYRNSRPALVTAHALGFGIYKTPTDPKESGLVQMFEQNTLWKDIGYVVADGELKDGCPVTLIRTEKTSPLFLETHSDFDDLIVFKSFASKQEQDTWVAEQIKINLDEDELRSDDIIVINPNPLTTKTNVAPIRAILYQYGINSHTAGVDTAPDIFFYEDNIAFTGIYRAKGNEAAMVYVINAESCYDSNFDRAKIRNQLFTAITRSKAWVRVLGVGENMDKLIQEYNQVKSHQYTLEFVYPTKSQRNKMNIVNRDMSEAERHRIKRSKDSITDILAGLESGEIYKEDLGEDILARLRALLQMEE